MQLSSIIPISQNSELNSFRTSSHLEIQSSHRQTQLVKPKTVLTYEDGVWKKVAIVENQFQTQRPQTQALPIKAQQSLNNSSNVIDYSKFYRCFNDIFLLANLNESKQLNQRTQFRDFGYLIQENCKLYSVFTQLINNQHDQNIDLLVDFDVKNVQSAHFQGIQGSQKDKEEAIKQALVDAQIKERYQQLKKNLSIITLSQTTNSQGNFRLDQIANSIKQSELYFRVVKDKPEVYDIITWVMGRHLGYKWRELPHGVELTHSWNLLWTWSKIRSSLDNLLVWQRFNHFPESKQITRKDLLKKNIEKLQRVSKRSKMIFDIIPQTFILPQEYTNFLQAFQQADKEHGSTLNYWICKPPGKSRGRGIFLVNDMDQLRTSEPLVVQRYLKNPLLINGHKFDMRIYVFVTSFNPLEAFIYKEGFARFSTVPFSLDPNKKEDRLIHLTNYSVQKTQFTEKLQEKIFNARKVNWIGSAFKEGCAGSKLSLSNLRAALAQKYVSWESEIWPQIKDIVIKTLIAGQYQNGIPFNPSAFELYGFDIIIDSKKKCWLIEVNSSPSLATDSHLDQTIKRALIKESINLLDPLDYDRQRLAEVLQRKLHEQNRYNYRSNSQQIQQSQMNRDLTYILNGKVPREYGVHPSQMGNFEMIAPSSQYDQIMQSLKLVQSTSV